jgi:hypothetical protein
MTAAGTSPPNSVLREKQSRIRKLRAVRERIAALEMELRMQRQLRDALAYELVEEFALTWRETAEFAGFENPYIARILRERRAEA